MLLNPYRFSMSPSGASGHWVVNTNSGAYLQRSDDRLSTWTTEDLASLWPTPTYPYVAAQIIKHGGLWVMANGRGERDGTTDAGLVVTSDDEGTTWTPSATAYDNQGYGFNAGASNGTVIVFVGPHDAGKSFIYSSDAINWSFGAAIGTYKGWQTVVWAGGSINKFIAATNRSPGNVATSSDGASWTLQTTTPMGDIRFATTSPMVFNGNRLVRWGAGNSDDYLEFVHSTNGVNWTLVTSSILENNVYVGTLIWDGTRFVLMIWSSVANSYTLTSSDGLTWTAKPALPAQVITIGFDGTTYLAPKNDSSGTYYTSTDLSTWTTHTAAMLSSSAGAKWVQWLPD